MSEQFQEIEVERRENITKKSRSDMRRSGIIPAVVYGGGKEPVPIAVDAKKVIGILRSPKGANSVLLFSLKGTSAKRHVMIKDFQIDPISNALVHADFRRIAMDQKLRVEIPIEFSGLAFGVKNEGGMVDILLREIEVECLPKDIPEKIHVDLAPLHLHQAVTIAQLDPGPGVTIIAEDQHLPVVHVVPTRVVAEPTPAEAEGAEASQEPEVVGKGKKAAEGEEGEDKDKAKEKAKK